MRRMRKIFYILGTFISLSLTHTDMSNYKLNSVTEDDIKVNGKNHIYIYIHIYLFIYCIYACM